MANAPLFSPNSLILFQLKRSSSFQAENNPVIRLANSRHGALDEEYVISSPLVIHYFNKCPSNALRTITINEQTADMMLASPPTNCHSVQFTGLFANSKTAECREDPSFDSKGAILAYCAHICIYWLYVKGDGFVRHYQQLVLPTPFISGCPQCDSGRSVMRGTVKGLAAFFSRALEMAVKTVDNLCGAASRLK